MSFPGETATVSVPDKKFRSTCRFCINYQASIRKSQVPLRFYEQEIAFPGFHGNSPDNPLTLIIERPRPLVAGFQVASPIAVKSSSLSAVSLTATTLRHSIFAFLASVCLETIHVCPYEGTLPSPTNHVPTPSFSYSFSVSRSLSGSRTI